jgi:hypothetical protein
MPTNAAADLVTGQSDDKQFSVTLLLTCLVLSLSNVAAVLISPVMAQAVELMGQY